MEATRRNSRNRVGKRRTDAGRARGGVPAKSQHPDTSTVSTATEFTREDDFKIKTENETDVGIKQELDIAPMELLQRTTPCSLEPAVLDDEVKTEMEMDMVIKQILDIQPVVLLQRITSRSIKPPVQVDICARSRPPSAHTQALDSWNKREGDLRANTTSVLKRRASSTAFLRRDQVAADMAVVVDVPPPLRPPAPSSSATSFKRPRPLEPREPGVISESYETREQVTAGPVTPRENVMVSTTPSGTEEVLFALENEEWTKSSKVLCEQEKTIVEVPSTKNIQQDITSQVTSSLATSIEPSILSANTQRPIFSADVHVSGDEEMTNNAEESSIDPIDPTVILDIDNVSSEYDDQIYVKHRIFPTPSEIQRDLPNDEELVDEVAASIRAMEAVMDADHERLLSGDVNFEWQEDFSKFSGMEEFVVQATGTVKSYDSPYDAFIDIFDDSIMKKIATETNRYAQQIINEAKAAGTFTKDKRMYRWKNTTVDELYRLFAVFIFMGICQRTSLEDYWKKDSVLEMTGFRKLMSIDRYMLLSKCLHFTDNEKKTVAKSVGSISRKLYKLHPIISHLNDKFQTLYVLHRHITIDGSLTLFKGRLSFVKYIKMKSACQGIKSFELCESQTGYLYKFVIYTGSTPDEAEANVDGGSGGARDSVKGRGRGASGDDPRVGTMTEVLAGKSTQVVLKLLEGLEGKGYCVTMDSFYNSPALARYLKFRGFDCLGTVRLTRKNIPEDVKKVTRKSEKGTIAARHSGDVMVLSWKDAKVVSMISTYHDDSTHADRRTGGSRVKPLCVHDYNMTMAGIDLKDQKLALYLMERKRGIKWYVKMFKRLLNASVHNAYVLFRDSQMTTTFVTGQNKILTHSQVRHQIADALMRRHTPPAPVRALMSQPSLRLDTTKKHLPVRGNRTRCWMCALKYDTESRSVIKCSVCQVALCVMGKDCFFEYHTLETLPETRQKRGEPKQEQGMFQKNRQNRLI